MIEINSQFRTANLNEADRHDLNRIGSELNVYEGPFSFSDVPLCESGMSLRTADELEGLASDDYPNLLNDEILSHFLSTIDQLIQRVRGHFSNVLQGHFPNSANISKAFIDDDDSDDLFHIDTGGSLMILAFGGVAKTECVSGKIWVDKTEFYNGQDELNFHKSTVSAIENNTACCTAIDNANPVLLNDHSDHRRGSIIVPGWRTLLTFRFNDIDLLSMT